MPIHDYRGIVSEKVEEYLIDLLPPRSEVLVRLEKDAERNNVPIVGPVVGRFLQLIATTCKAKKILEVGTATGYSGIWLGTVAMKNNGKLTTIESDPSRAKIASKSFLDAGISSSVEIVTGDARKEVPRIARQLSGQLDVAFIDVGDKSLYVELLDDCVKALRVGGFLLADNTLWKGLVATDAKDKDTATLREFNKRVYADERLFPSVVSLRDGVTVALKLKEK